LWKIPTVEAIGSLSVVVPERVQGDLIEVAQDPAFLAYRGPDDPRERRDTAT
jgi:hypothetical protein